MIHVIGLMSSPKLIRFVFFYSFLIKLFLILSFNIELIENRLSCF